MLTLLLFVGGLALLVVGAEVLVRGAATLARRFGIAPLIVGLTVVAFGTSAPEMAVSAKAALAGQGDLAVGNVVGSNIFNVLFILGLSALVVPLVVQRQLVRIDVPIMIAMSLLVWFMGYDGVISMGEGIFLLLGIVAYTGLQVVMGLRDKTPLAGEGDEPAPPRSGKGIATDFLLVAVGLVLLVLGADWLVRSAVVIARSLGVSELVIGLTIVAAGTSLPEVATSVMAAIKGQRDIAVGNVVGSNIFNLLAVLGIGAVVAPEAGLGVSASVLAFDIPVMVLVAVVCLPIFITGWVISRKEGMMLLGAYVAYTAYIVVKASG